MQVITDIIGNIIGAGFAIAVLLGVFYLLLTILDWRLRRKIGDREQEGLTALWATSRTATKSGRNDPTGADEAANSNTAND